MTTIRRAAVVAAVLFAVLLAAPAVLLAAPFVLAAGVTSAVTRRARSASRTVPWQQLVRYEPVIGWRPRANLDVYGRGDDPFHLRTGPDGWRGGFATRDADIVVIGDSFAFGHSADEHRMYSARCGDLRVKPIGSDGYDMVHGLLWLERLQPELRGKLVVWFVFYGNDLWENLLPSMGHYRKPFVREDPDGVGWAVRADHVSSEPWPFPSGRSYHEHLAAICSPGTPLERRAFAACRHLVAQATARCREVEADLAVVGIPDRVQLTRRGRAKLASLAPRGHDADPQLPDRRFAAICEELGVPFAPLTSVLTSNDYLVQDIHWRGSGHRKVASVLRDLHDRRGARDARADAVGGSRG